MPGIDWVDNARLATARSQCLTCSRAIFWSWVVYSGDVSLFPYADLTVACVRYACDYSLDSSGPDFVRNCVRNIASCCSVSCCVSMCMYFQWWRRGVGHCIKVGSVLRWLCTVCCHTYTPCFRPLMFILGARAYGLLLPAVHNFAGFAFFRAAACALATAAHT